MSEHPNVIHVDDIEPRRGGTGDLASARRTLAAAAGARAIGLSRWEIPPGKRSTPVHVHADEEEIFYVLGGSGLSWQDGRTYAIGEGDCLVHRVNAEAHTVIAGDDGLDVLAFAEGSRTNITFLPRTNMFWLGARWVPADQPNPFKSEALAGPLEVPPPEAERPGTIVHRDDVEPLREEQPGYEGEERMLSAAAGAVSSGLRHVVLQPGAMSCPPHVHFGQEECFYVLDGTGTLWLDDERFALRAGSVVVRPPATRVAHALVAGPGGMTYLAYGQRATPEIVLYPRSNKLNLGGRIFRVEALDYFDGEPDGA